MTKRGGFFETLGGLSADYTEIALDQLQDKLTNDEVLRELPVIKTVIGLVRAPIAIRDRLFIKKVQEFLESRDPHTREQGDVFIRRLDTEPKGRERLAEAIILLLDQFDDMDKPVLFARAFSAFVRNEIGSLYLFRRYGEIIKAANVTHLQNLYPDLAEEEGGNRPIYTSVADQVLPLSSFGLIELRNERPAHVTIAPEPGKTAHYVSTDFGRRFVRTVIREEDIEEDVASGD